MSKISLAFKIIIIVAVVVGLFFGISYFMPGDATPDAGVSGVGYQATDLSESQAANLEFIALLDKIKKIELATEIIESVSRKFEDFSPALPEIAADRPNPFAPIGVSRGAGAPILAPEATSTPK